MTKKQLDAKERDLEKREAMVAALVVKLRLATEKVALDKARVTAAWKEVKAMLEADTQPAHSNVIQFKMAA